MNGFGFLEYDDAMDARDVVPGIIGLDSVRITWKPLLILSSLP